MDTIMREINTTSCTLVFIVLPRSNWDSTPDLFWSTTIFCQPLISNSGWNLFSFSVSGAEQRGGDQGDHEEELGEEPELAWQGDQDPQGAHRVAPRQRRRTPRLQGKPPTCWLFNDKYEGKKLRNLLPTTSRPLCLAIFIFCKLEVLQQCAGTGLYFLQPSLRSPDCSLKSSAVGGLMKNEADYIFTSGRVCKAAAKSGRNSLAAHFGATWTSSGTKSTLLLMATRVAVAIATYDVSK